jgi:hypothetical protein
MNRHALQVRCFLIIVFVPSFAFAEISGSPGNLRKLVSNYKKGAAFRLGDFHDALLACGSLPLSVVEWILLDDPSSVEKALGGADLTRRPRP